jgi:hypothetical protein
MLAPSAIASRIDHESGAAAGDTVLEDRFDGQGVTALNRKLISLSRNPKTGRMAVIEISIAYPQQRPIQGKKGYSSLGHREATFRLFRRGNIMLPSGIALPAPEPREAIHQR